jgi:ABC-2 type transport system permease protein
MTATSPPTTADAASAGVHTQTLADVIASEWIKIRTVRSTSWTLAAAFVLTVAFGALLSWGVAATWDPADEMGGIDALSTSLAGMLFGELALVVFGVLFITAEYSTGGIRATLVSVPKRSRVVVAKTIVVAGVALVVSTVTVLVSFFIGQALLASEGLNVGLGDPNVLRALVGSALYLTAAALFGLGIGLVVRSSGGGITAAIAGLIVLPSLSGLLPGQWGQNVGKFITTNAGRPITLVETNPDSLGPWVGYAVFVGWAVALLVVGTIALRRRDV